MANVNSLFEYLLYDLKCASYPPATQKQIKNMKKEDREFLEQQVENLKNAHPHLPAEEIERGEHTHTLMTGSKLLFHAEPIPAHVVFPGAFSELHISLREAFRVQEAFRVLDRQETYDDMLWLILKETSVNKKWMQDACLTEAISRPYHRFFLDLDLLLVKEHDINHFDLFVRRICLSVGKAIMLCYPDMATSRDPRNQCEFSVLCTEGYRAKKLSETVTVYKRGIHMVWPGVIVDRERAECLARLIDEHLTRDVPRDLQGGENSWKDAIDMSAYVSGLRPAGCPKITPCAVCRSIAQKEVAAGTSYEYSARSLEYLLCHPPYGFIPQGKESVYSLNMISRGDGVALNGTNYKNRLASHVLKDEVTGKEYDFSLQKLTSIHSTETEPTPGFTPPLHLQAPFIRELSDFNVHVKQDPETGDYLPPPKRRNLNPRNSHSTPLVLSNVQMESMTRILHNFHPKYANIILDKVWAFPNEDASKMLPPRPGWAPKRSLYSHLWFTVKGEGSHYCHNKAGMHASNTIRFHVDYQGNIYQGCWCMKTYNGKICSKQTTEGKSGFISKMFSNNLLADIFSTQIN